MDNIIFCDFDGVLTSTYETPGSYINHDNDGYGISDACYYNLEQLCIDTNSRVVISSNWRRYADDGCWINPKTKAKFTNRLPLLKKRLGDLYAGQLNKIRHIRKVDALKMYLKKHDDINFVIFDDELKEGFQDEEKYGISSRFIQTDNTFGLSKLDVEKAKKILNKGS